MDPLKSLEDNLGYFKKIIVGLANIGEKKDDKNQ